MSELVDKKEEDKAPEVAIKKEASEEASKAPEKGKNAEKDTVVASTAGVTEKDAGEGGDGTDEKSDKGKDEEPKKEKVEEESETVEEVRNRKG